MKSSKSARVVSFEKLLPLLASTYQRGRLVPFIGAGMSSPELALWPQFLANLEAEAAKILETEAQQAPGREIQKVVPSTSPKGPEISFEMRAQRAATIIRNSRGDPCFFAAVRNALRCRNTPVEIPRQTEALAAIRWPLIVSTNYDDLLYGTCYLEEQSPLQPVLMGRTAMDCKIVVSSLNSPIDRQCVWHIQGFLGGQHPQSGLWMSGLRQQDRDRQFEHELVVGHCEYRRVTTSAVHFRRCFGEVFRSRSLLFLGSSLTENYFLNLFGETLDLVGPSHVPHFAFVKEGEVDPHFLSDQMNITVCEYSDHGRLAGWLERLKEKIDRPESRVVRWSSTVVGHEDLQVSALPIPMVADLPRGEALAIVSRHDAGGRPCFPPILDSGLAASLEAEFRGVRFEPGKFVLRAPCGNIYAVSARAFGVEGADDHTTVRMALAQLLDAVCHDGFQAFHLKLPSRGGNVPPVYGFMEAVRSFGCWKRDHLGTSLRAVLYVGHEVVLNLTSQRIDLQELLTSNLLRFWTEVSSDPKGEPSRRVFHYPPTTGVSDLLQELGVPASRDWMVSICPSPRLHAQPVCTSDLAPKKLVDIGIVFGSTLTVSRAQGGECHFTTSA